MSTSRVVILLVFALILPQLAGCRSLQPIPLQSLPTRPENAQPSERVGVITAQGPHIVYLSGIWIDADTLRGTGPHQNVRIPIKDIEKIGHYKFSFWRTAALAGGGYAASLLAAFISVLIILG